MDDFERFEAILALGRKLVDELGMEPSVDTLGRWMAHHIADLILKSEKEEGEEWDATRRECFDTILALWTHRNELPDGSRPFEKMEPILRAVESLDPDDETPRYLRQARPHNGNNKEESEADTWLTLVDGLDYAAKLLIGYCLAQAANSAIDKSEEWVKQAEAAGQEEGPAELVIRFVAPGDERSEQPDQNKKLRERLEYRLERLNGFTKIANALADDLNTKLQQIE